MVRKFIRLGLESGIVSDGFLFRGTAFRISPPLIISEEQIIEACEQVSHVLDRCAV